MEKKNVEMENAAIESIYGEIDNVRKYELEIIRLAKIVAVELYKWADEGTPVMRLKQVIDAYEILNGVIEDSVRGVDKK